MKRKRKRRERRERERAAAKTKAREQRERHAMLREVTTGWADFLELTEPSELVLVRRVHGVLVLSWERLTPELLCSLVAGTPDRRSQWILAQRTRETVKVGLVSEQGVTFALVQKDGEQLVNAPGGAA